jgi:hypothetical protein
MKSQRPTTIPKVTECCYVGHHDCLGFLIEHGAPVNDSTARIVVMREHLESIALLAARGVPPVATPFLYPADFVTHGDRGGFLQGQLECIKRINGNGCPIHPGTLIWGARGGDLKSVRFLHGIDVKFWEYACKEEDIDDINFSRNADVAASWKRYMLKEKILVVPQAPEEPVLRAMQYGWMRGAPMTPAVEALFRAKRAATRATLLCFHVATALSRKAETPPELRTSFAAMGRIPMELIEILLEEAGLETKDTLRCSLPAGSSRPRVWEGPTPLLMVWTWKHDTCLKRMHKCMLKCMHKCWLDLIRTIVPQPVPLF